MVILDIKRQPYDRPLSTVFGAPEKLFAQLLKDDADPIMNELQTLDYRYVRFFFHPLKDKFVVCNGWKDPSWTRVRALRAGIDGDEKDERERVFGANLIDIQQKSIPQLLVDEVRHLTMEMVIEAKTYVLGIPSLLCIPNSKSGSMVARSILLLRCLYICHVCRKYHCDPRGDACCK